MLLPGRVAVCVVVSLLACSEAHADEDEASVHLQLVGGLAYVGDSDATNADPDDTPSGEVASAPLGGVAGRFSYATNDWYQFDASLTLAATGGAAFEHGTFAPPDVPPQRGPFSVSMQVARLDAGVTARLGVRFIPTVRLAVGAQGRRTSSPSGFNGTVRDPELGVDLVAVGSVGFDYRLSSRTILGIAAGGTYALPLGGSSFQTLEATVFWSHYWYPQ